MKTYFKTVFVFFALLFSVTQISMAQVDLGIDIMSRYVWRGTDFGASPSLQPDISYTSGNLTIAGWAAMATNGNPAGSEIDFYASYALGNFSLNVADYTFPEASFGSYFESESHLVEIGIGYSGTDAFPLSVTTGMFVANDEDYSIYVEIGYRFSNVDLFLGFTPAESAMYGTSKAGIVNTGLTASQDVKITELFSIALSGSVIVNPYANNAFFLFGLGF